MKGKIIVLLIIIALISNANALIQPEKNEISIVPTESFSLPIKIVNDSGEKALIHLTSESLLETEFSINDFYLNAGEETNIALNIIPSYYYKEYLVEMKMEYNSITEYADLSVLIGNSPGSITLNYTKQNVCGDKLDKLSLWIKNETTEEKTIKLSAESELFMPTVNPEEMTLNAGEEKFVELELYSNNSFSLEKEYSVIVNIESNETIVSREIFFYLTECLETQRFFTLDLDERNLSLNKGQTKRIYFTVKNMQDEDNEIFFAVKSDLKSELQQTKTVLAPNETRTYWIEVEARNSDETGEHRIEVYAFNAFYETKKVFYANVRGMHEISALLLSSPEQIQRGHSKIFTLLIENKGDFRERINIREFEEEDISLHFSEKSFYLNEKELKKVYISVNPAIDSALGEKEIELEVNGKEITLNFEVVEEDVPLLTSDVIEFLLVPEKITLTEEKTKITVLIKNISGKKLEDIVFWVDGLPNNVVFESNIIEEINDEKTKYVEGTFILDSDAVKGNYDITLHFENNEFRQEKAIKLIVLEETKSEEKKEEIIPWFPAGLVSFGSGQLIGLTVIALLIIILLLNPGKTVKTKTRKTWLNYKGELN